MARYFFDVHDDIPRRDDEGSECATREDVRLKAMRLLPNIARDEVGTDDGRHTYTVLVTAEDGSPVYSATLSIAGLWLTR